MHAHTLNLGIEILHSVCHDRIGQVLEVFYGFWCIGEFGLQECALVRVPSTKQLIHELQAVFLSLSLSLTVTHLDSSIEYFIGAATNLSQLLQERLVQLVEQLVAQLFAFLIACICIVTEGLFVVGAESGTQQSFGLGTECLKRLR
jgi:hypothetical protein